MTAVVAPAGSDGATATGVCPLLALDLRLVTRGAVAPDRDGGRTEGGRRPAVRRYIRVAGKVRSLEVLVGNPAIRVLFGEPSRARPGGGLHGVAYGNVRRCGGRRLGVRHGDPADPRTGGHRPGVAHAGWAAPAAFGPPRPSAGDRRHSDPFGLALGLAMVASGAGSRGATVYATGTALTGLLFAGVGTASGQLLGERRSATGLAAGMLDRRAPRPDGGGRDRLDGLGGLADAVRVALPRARRTRRTGGYRLGCWHWVSRWSVGAAWMMAGRRDLGSGVLSGRRGRRPRLGLLSSVWGFAVRRTLPAFVGWGLALAAYFLLIGRLAVSLTEFLAANPRFATWRRRPALPAWRPCRATSRRCCCCCRCRSGCSPRPG